MPCLLYTNMQMLPNCSLMLRWLCSCLDNVVASDLATAWHCNSLIMMSVAVFSECTAIGTPSFATSPTQPKQRESLGSVVFLNILQLPRFHP